MAPRQSKLHSNIGLKPMSGVGESGVEGDEWGVVHGSHSKVGGLINRNVVAHRPNRLQQNDI